MVQGSFQWGSRVFERSSKGISGVGKGVSWKFQRFSKKVFRMLQGTFKGVSMEFMWVSRVFIRSSMCEPS